MKASDKKYTLIKKDAKAFLAEIRDQLRRNKKLDADTFNALSRLCKSKDIHDIISENLNTKEVTVLGHAIMRAKKLDVDSFIRKLTSDHSTKNATLLTYLLLKRSKIKNTNLVVEFLKPVLGPNVRLCYLNLLLVIYRNYQTNFDKTLQSFCLQNSHPICAEIGEHLLKETGKKPPSN